MSALRAKQVPVRWGIRDLRFGAFLELGAWDLEFGFWNFHSEFPSIADAELEPARAAVELVVVNGDAIVQAQRADGQVEAQAQAPVVGVITQVVMIRQAFQVANVVEQREADTDAGAALFLLLKDGDAVFGRTKPIGVAADWFGDARLARADTAI